jgi:hypothetical protein
MLEALIQYNQDNRGQRRIHQQHFWTPRPQCLLGKQGNVYNLNKYFLNYIIYVIVKTLILKY